jgi:tetratricopeptide (TPR) repeat protein
VSPTRTLTAFGFSLLIAATVRTLAQDNPAPPPTPPPATPPTTPAPPETPAAEPPAPPAPLSEEAQAALQQAKDAFKKGAWGEANDAALKVLQSQPKHLEALYIAGASERQLNQLTDAEGRLKALVETQPLFPLSHFQLGYVLFLEAEGLTHAGQVDAAKPKYIEAASEFGKELQGRDKDKPHVPSLSSRSIALARAGQIDDSIQAHEAWIAAVPQKNDPVVSLAGMYAGAGRSTEAMSTLDRLPDKSPKSTLDATIAVATVFTSRRDWPAAVPFLEKAVAVDATSTRARAMLTESCARAGMFNDAAASLQTLLTMEPTPDEAETVGEAIKATMGNGKSAPSITGVEPPQALRIPAPRYPTGPDRSVETEVLVLAQIRPDNAVANTLMVPNRIWKDIRTTGFEAAALDAVKRGKFVAGTKDGQPAQLWLVVDVKFTK